MNRCSVCKVEGHKRTTCPIALKDKYKRRTERRRMRYDFQSNMVFINALRDFLGLAPLHGEVPRPTQEERFASRFVVEPRGGTGRREPAHWV